MGDLVNNNLFFSDKGIMKGIRPLKSKSSDGNDENSSSAICLFNIILADGDIPKYWKVSRITPIQKKGDKMQVSSYRPVSVISSLIKVFENCLIAKLS